MRPSPSKSFATLLLLISFWLATHSMMQKSPVFDEQGYITRGLGYLRGENRHMRIGHPLGLNALNALLLVGDPSVKLPTDDPSWQLTSFHRPSELFLWEIGNDVEQIMLRARIPTVLLGLLLNAIVFRWAKDASGKATVGLIALIVVSFDPNLLAHMRFTTTDLGVSFGAALAGYSLWRYLTKPTVFNATMAAIGFGLLNNSKFTAGLFVPLFTLVIITCWLLDWRRMGWHKLLRTHLKFVLIFPSVSFLTLWASYGFEIGTMPDALPALPQLAGLRLPLAHHLEQLLDIGNRSTKGAASYLLGDYSRDGWWYYFPVAFVLKTPIASLLFFVTGLIFWLLRWRRLTLDQSKTLLATCIPAFGYMLIAMTTSVNLGYRHLLPMLPYLAVMAAVGWSFRLSEERSQARGNPAQQKRSGLSGKLALFGMMLALTLSTLSIAPHYLAYFNLFAGGADNGWRLLSDSNIDWGQDLKLLAGYLSEEGIDPVQLSYFGEARPDYYKMSYRGLTSYPPRLVHPDANPLYPPKPAPGVYAISATNLVGVLFDDKDEFAWFRARQPDAKIGHSIFIYRVSAETEPIALVLQNISLQAVPPDLYAQLGSNNIRPIRQTEEAMTFPAEGGWLLKADTMRLQAIDYPSEQAAAAYRDLGLWQFDEANTTFTFADGMLSGQTTWLVTEASAAALQIFVHALDENEAIIGQSDRLDVLASDLRAGDRIVQQHDFAVSQRPVALRIGLYDWQSGELFGEPIILPFER